MSEAPGTKPKAKVGTANVAAAVHICWLWT
jgi:hypothetical protein